MITVTLQTRKGGSGKTTLACSLAVAASSDGVRTLILDADPQMTANAWLSSRAADVPDLMCVASPAKIPAAMEAASRGYGLVLVDTPGVESASNAALRASDLCLIPCRPTVPDLLAATQTAEAARLLNRAAAFVLTQVPSRGHRRALDASQGLAVHAPVAPCRIAFRNAYADAQALGLGVTEFEPRGKAADEIRSLWNWLRQEVENTP